MSEVIFQCAERFFQQEKAQERLCGVRIVRPKALGGLDLAITCQERGAGLVAPVRQGRGQLAVIVGGGLQGVIERNTDRAVDRAQEACDIFRRRRLAATLGQRLLLVAIEINDEDVILDDQDLAEMKIAMQADIAAADVVRDQMAQPLGQFAAPGEHLIDEAAFRVLEVVAPLDQSGKDPVGLGAKPVDPMIEAVGCGRLGGKIGDVAPRSAARRLGR